MVILTNALSKVTTFDVVFSCASSELAAILAVTPPNEELEVMESISLTGYKTAPPVRIKRIIPILTFVASVMISFSACFILSSRVNVPPSLLVIDPEVSITKRTFGLTCVVSEVLKNISVSSPKVEGAYKITKKKLSAAELIFCLRIFMVLPPLTSDN